MKACCRRIEDTLTPAFKIPAPKGEPIIQIAEPFDGVDHSYMITPLIGSSFAGPGLSRGASGGTQQRA